MTKNRIPFKISDNIFYIISQFDLYSKISKKKAKRELKMFWKERIL